MTDDPAQAPDAGSDEPEQGLRLVKAFLKIRDPAVRNALVVFVEQMAAAAAS